MLLADLGAEVIRVDRPAEAGDETLQAGLLRGRRSVTIDLKSAAGAEVALRLIDDADAVIEGFRPGVTERLGLCPETCLARNPRLVYGRMTGWGQEGPLAQEPGHDINYIAIAGALGAIGPADGDPVVPLNLVGDMGGGGMLLALGIAAALLHARATGEGQVVDAAMTDGTAMQLATVLGLRARGAWSDRRGANLLDGAAPFYAELLRVLELSDDPLFADQYDEPSWPAMSARLEELFAARSRDDWTEAFDGQGACVTPVLSLAEAAAHPHNVARRTYSVDEGGTIQPGPAPRFGATPSAPPSSARAVGADTDDVLAEAGLDPAKIDDLRIQGVIA
jgi:alpha-methylacyl-CoA racemase